VADRAPARGDGADRRYDTTTCTLRARRLFGVEPRWCPQDAGVRAALGDLTMTREDLPPIVDSTGWSATRDAATADLPIVGTDLCDAAVWPDDPRDSLAAIRGLTDVDVRVRRPDRPLPQPGLGVPRSWLVYAAWDIEPRPFLHQLDFYLHFPHPRTVETLSRPALEAAAVGCVVVLPESSAALYGDAAVYSTPDGVPELIRQYREDPARYAEQSRRARAVVAKAHHPQLFADRITGVLRPPALPAPRNGSPASGVTDVWPPDDLALAPAGTPHP
jgi:hypothetical protein